MSRSRPRRRSAAAPRTLERVRIEAIAAGGEGVGRLTDGRAVFVHRTAPGELVDTMLIQSRPRWARGRLASIIEPSRDRRPAPCPHYQDCGGCTLEHLEYRAQLDVKAGIVRDALTRIGGIDIPTPTVVPSPREFRYRNRVSFALRRRGKEVEAGFHALHDPSRIVPVDGACLLPEEPIALAWDQLRGEWGPGAQLLPAGEVLRLTLRGTSAGAVSLLVEGGKSAGDPVALLGRVPALSAIWHNPEYGSLEHVGGAPGLPETWGDVSFEMAGSAFLQVNRGAAELLEGYVAELAGDLAGRRAIDAYCGIGAHTRRLARAGAAVSGIELDPAAAAIASDLAPPSASIHQGRVEDLLPSLLPADLVLLNPPRAGVAREALEALAAKPPHRILYISCDPATLARDVKRLADAFTHRAIRCFDMFPQTAHVETVLLLERREGVAP